MHRRGGIGEELLLAESGIPIHPFSSLSLILSDLISISPISLMAEPFRVRKIEKENILFAVKCFMGIHRWMFQSNPLIRKDFYDLRISEWQRKNLNEEERNEKGEEGARSSTNAEMEGKRESEGRKREESIAWRTSPRRDGSRGGVTSAFWVNSEIAKFDSQSTKVNEARIESWIAALRMKTPSRQ
jgi:hypothetical protein